MTVLNGKLLLKRLRRAVAKVRFLLSSGATRWLIIRSASGNRRLSFRDRQGLLQFTGDLSSSSNISEYFDAETSPFPSIQSSPLPTVPHQWQFSRNISSTRTGIVLTRTISGMSPQAPIVIPTVSRQVSGDSSSSGDEDVDWKSQQFIDKFRAHLLLERKTSLELRYLRKDSPDSSTSP